ncbi:MAG: hypothetical protein EWV92_17370 [Microcystis aeruginosa Ma_MB_S_20031200_S102]|uniref:Uncharacterized protein n=1 Tax=Microcystis aeruginosa Ma_MB_S_20031200_S102 TaxID=2486254 RepID=A0A552EFP7_MICAE|nr:MAG: hypothetical protein EWV79_17315 [Microcystis aeruginosa Ma_MB_S_20031200_S102D]TRU33267.1 MAG: hypothetical protein EWV92_17370 [Microcystis aeruginosa Ma_MB_S_20031200_S102]
MQDQFQATYIYGVVEPKIGEHLFYKFAHLNSQCFQIFLELVSEYFFDKYLSKINYTYLTPSCLLPLAFCLSLLGN